jgi:hypothetical protein
MTFLYEFGGDRKYSVSLTAADNFQYRMAATIDSPGHPIVSGYHSYERFQTTNRIVACQTLCVKSIVSCPMDPRFSYRSQSESRLIWVLRGWVIERDENSIHNYDAYYYYTIDALNFPRNRETCKKTK